MCNLNIKQQQMQQDGVAAEQQQNRFNQYTEIFLCFHFG
jgi:hypothetical protein